MAEFNYEVKGVVLTMEDMVGVHRFYEAACTAEFLMENYDLETEEALEKAYDVRRLMNKYDFTEAEAINEVMERGEEEE